MANVDHLFLLEFMVNSVSLTCKFGGCIAVQQDRKPLRVRVKFLDFSCFEINQTDFSNYQDDFQFSSLDFSTGKSCLFPMHPFNLIRAVQHFPILVTVFEVDAEDENHPTILGLTRIKFTASMIDSIKNAAVCPHQCPISEVIKDTFLLKSLKDEDAGYITVFIRLSCFGTSIVTKFKMKQGDDAFLFKNSKPEGEFQCKTCSAMSRTDSRSKFDVIPLNPMISTDENVFEDFASTMPDRKCSHVSWRNLTGQVCRTKSNVSKMLQTTAVTSPPVATQDLKYPSYTPFPMSSGGREICRCLKDISRRLPGSRPRKCTCHECPGQIEEPKDPKFLNPMVRYDTTGALSPAFMGHPYVQNPPVRYDTTSFLSPAFNGALPPKEMLMTNKMKPNPPVRYDTTSLLSSAYVTSMTSFQKTKKEYKESSMRLPIYSIEMDAESSTGGDSLLVKKKKKKKKRQRAKDPKISCLKRKKKMIELFDPFFTFEMVYPGVLTGHKECATGVKRVPPTMGWMWKTSDIGKGWRPGAVPKSVSSIIEAHRLASGRGLPTGGRKRRKRRDGKGGDLPEKEAPPTLHLSKKEGAYNIRVNTLTVGKSKEPMEINIPRMPKEEDDQGSTSSDGSGLDVQFRAPVFFKHKFRAPRRYYTQGAQCLENDFASGDKKMSEIKLPTEEEPTPSLTSSDNNRDVRIKSQAKVKKEKKGKKAKKKK